MNDKGSRLNPTGGKILLLIFFYFHVGKPLVLMLPILPFSFAISSGIAPLVGPFPVCLVYGGFWFVLLFSVLLSNQVRMVIALSGIRL